MLILLLVVAFLSGKFILLEIVFLSRSCSILDALTFVSNKIMIEMSMLAFRVFSDPGFYFCFQFFRSDDLNRDPKRCLNALTLNFSCLCS